MSTVEVVKQRGRFFQSTNTGILILTDFLKLAKL